MDSGIEILTFDNLKDTYNFIKEKKVLDELFLFKNTKITKENKNNLGYVILYNGDVVGAASIFDEEDGIILNELFEIREKYRGMGFARKLYEYIIKDSLCDGVHGFCTTDENQSFWEHMGQVCIDTKTREMLEMLNPM